MAYDCYLQNTSEIEIMEAGILHRVLDFSDGHPHRFTYDFAHPAYQQLIAQYAIDKTAGEGSAFDKALRLMYEYAPRLHHESCFGGDVPMDGLSLLAYSLDNSQQGINCRCKAQILNEMCLALGIYSRKVWIMPLSIYDCDCHVVNEIWDEQLNKWIMLDITSNTYWVGEDGIPLSLLEIRDKGAAHAFCTPVAPGQDLSNLQTVKQQNIADFLYIMKNLVYLKFPASYTVGENGSAFILCPQSLLLDDPKTEIARASCESTPHL